MTFSRRIGLAPIWVALAIALLIVLAVSLATPKPAGAVLDEIVAALCNGGDPLEPPGQTPPRSHGKSELRALQATGFITSIVETANNVTINFDSGVPASKFSVVSPEADLVLPNFFGPGVSLTLSPEVEPDPNFPAHVHCFNF